MICISEVVDISHGNLDSRLWFIQPAFHMIYSTYKLNKQGDHIQPWYTPFPILNQSVIPCLVLTAASWLAYRFQKRQVRWSSIPLSLRIFQFVVIHPDKGFCICREAEVDVFLEFSCFFYDPTVVRSNMTEWSRNFSLPVNCPDVDPTHLLAFKPWWLLGM